MTMTASELTHLDVIRMMAKEGEELKEEMHLLREQFVAYRTESDKRFTELAEAHTQMLRLMRLQHQQTAKTAWKHNLH